MCEYVDIHPCMCVYHWTQCKIYAFTMEQGKIKFKTTDTCSMISIFALKNGIPLHKQQHDNTGCPP